MSSRLCPGCGQMRPLIGVPKDNIDIGNQPVRFDAHSAVPGKKAFCSWAGRDVPVVAEQRREGTA